MEQSHREFSSWSVSGKHHVEVWDGRKSLEECNPHSLTFFWASSGSVNINSLHVSSGLSSDWETRRDKLNIEQNFYLERCDIGV